MNQSFRLAFLLAFGEYQYNSYTNNTALSTPLVNSTGLSLMSQSPQQASSSSFWILLAPAVFVLLWSTGFIGARMGVPYSEPFTFLAYRFLMVAVCLFLFSFVIKSSWPKSFAAAAHTSVAGLLIHGCYLGGVFFAIENEIGRAHV